MEKFIGVEGIVKGVIPEINELIIAFMVTNRYEPNMQHWTYPLDEYLVLQREQRLNEIGI
jgi:hypothetical protein